MNLAKRANGWWIEGADPYYVDGEGPFTAYGPYSTKEEAASDLRGLLRFEREWQKECAEHDSATELFAPGSDDTGNLVVAQPSAV